MEQKIYEIEVITQEKMLDNGVSFKIHHTYDKHNKKVTVKFVKTCKQLPENGRHIVLVKSNNMNLDLSSRFPTLWVKEVEEIREPKKKDTVADYFD